MTIIICTIVRIMHMMSQTVGRPRSEAREGLHVRTMCVYTQHAYINQWLLWPEDLTSRFEACELRQILAARLPCFPEIQLWPCVMMGIRLGRFRRVPDSTWFQIENRNRGSTLLTKRVPASLSSGADSFKYLIPRAEALVKFWGPDSLWWATDKCNSRLQRTCEGAAHN